MVVFSKMYCNFGIHALHVSLKYVYFILNSEINAYQTQIKVISITSEVI